MNPTDVAMLEAVCERLAQVAGVRMVRLKGAKQKVEVPLSRYVAVTVEPAGAELLAWPDVPVGRYRLVHWRASVLDRALPGTRALEALASVAEACREAILSDLSLGGRAADGPASAREEELVPAVGATRTGPLRLGDAAAGEPTAIELSGASGRWEESPAGAAALDDELLFSSGPHVVEVGSPVRRVKDQAFNGLAGGLALDLGEGPRDILQRGVLSAASAEALAQLEMAIESFIDGRAYILTSPDGTDYPNCRMERFERLSPPLVGAQWHRRYRIAYRQLAR
jgi:hypothetical protein